MESNLSIGYAAMADLEGWMALLERMRWNFPGLETQELVDGYRATVEKNIRRQSAVCAKADGRLVGFLLFSAKHNMLCHLAVDPQYRRRGIAMGMVALMLQSLDPARDVAVITFRAGDPKGDAPRALYQRLGFIPGELCCEMGYPEQRFRLPAPWLRR